jgi:hypothetical protein
MMFLLLALLAAPVSHAVTYPMPSETVAKFGGPEGFCNLMERIQKKPEVRKSCRAIIVLEKSEGVLEALKGDAFGKFLLLIGDLGTEVHAVVEISVEQLDRLQYDPRLMHIAPDSLMGPVGGFTVKN